jgi:hypothetical protein
MQYQLDEHIEEETIMVPPKLVRHNAVRQESSSGTIDPSTSITTDRQAQAQDRQAQVTPVTHVTEFVATPGT